MEKSLRTIQRLKAQSAIRLLLFGHQS